MNVIYPRLKSMLPPRSAAAKGSNVADPRTLQDWLVKPGDVVSAGQALAVVELVKTTHEVAAPADGVVAALEVAAQDTFGRGAVLARLEPKA